MNKFVHHVKRISLLVMVGLLPSLGEAKPKWIDEPLATDPEERVEPCDWTEVYGRAGDGVVQIALRCAKPIDFAKAGAYCVFIDVDGERNTGFRGGEDNFPIGADYLLQGATLFRFSADNGTAWSWYLVGETKHVLADDWLDYTIPVDQMWVTAPEVTIFLLGDNAAPGIGEDKRDELPDGALRAGGGGKSVTITMESKEKP